MRSLAAQNCQRLSALESPLREGWLKPSARAENRTPARQVRKGWGFYLWHLPTHNTHTHTHTHSYTHTTGVAGICSPTHTHTHTLIHTHVQWARVCPPNTHTHTHTTAMAAGQWNGDGAAVKRQKDLPAQLQADRPQEDLGWGQAK